MTMPENQPPRARKLSLREWLEQNPFAVVTGVVVSTALITLTVSQLISETRIENRVAEVRQVSEEKLAEERQASKEKLDQASNRLATSEALGKEREVRVTVQVAQHQLELEKLKGELAEKNEEISDLDGEFKDQEAAHRQLVSSLQSQLAAKEETHRAEVEKFKAQLDSVARVMQGGAIDPNKFVLRGDQRPPATSRAITEDGFYATADSSWEYSRTTEKWLAEELLTDEILQATGVALNEVGEKIRVHFWRTGAKIDFNKNRVLRQTFPHIFVQRVSKDQFSIFGPNSVIAEKDPLAFYLAFKIFAGVQLVAFDESISYRLIAVQKLQDDVAYAKYQYRITDEITPESMLATDYFITQELIVVNTPVSLFFIQTSYPSTDALQSEYESKVTAWLAGLAIPSR